MADSCIAVLDVGKSNKKVVVYDDQLRPLEAVSKTFDVQFDQGVLCEPVEETAAWFFASLKALSSEHVIKAVSVSSHGAAFACLDEKGALALPVLSYIYDPGEKFHHQFHERFGSSDDLHKKMATPFMPGLGCIAKGVYYLQEKHYEAFSRTETILNLPQYYGFLLTGQKGTEYTYLGTHTYLWDFDRWNYSVMVDQLGIRAKLPRTVSKPWDVLGTVTPDAARQTGLSEDTIVTLGIHDSNASLLPYLIKTAEPFALNSTGTVMVAMRPAEQVRVTDDMLGKAIYYNASAFSQPVRTSLFLGGLEFDTYLGEFQRVHGQQEFPGFDRDLCERILKERAHFILPSLIPFGIFPQSRARIVDGQQTYSLGDVTGSNRPPFIDDYGHACTVLTLSLAIQSKLALEQTGLQEGDTVFVEGGFHKNDCYTTLLSDLLPNSRVACSNLDEATAFGTALLAKAALEGKRPDEMGAYFELETRTVEKCGLGHLAEYCDTFLRHVA
jgi:sugar (pentulose or hexulose) kinase